MDTYKLLEIVKTGVFDTQVLLDCICHDSNTCSNFFNRNIYANTIKLITKYLDNKIIFNEEQIDYLIDKKKYFIISILLEYNHVITHEQFNKIKSNVFIPEIYIIKFGFQDLIDYNVIQTHIVSNKRYNEYNIVLTTEILDNILNNMIEQYCSGYMDHLHDENYIKILEIICSRNAEPPIDNERNDYGYDDDVFGITMINFLKKCKELFPNRYNKYFNQENKN